MLRPLILCGLLTLGLPLLAQPTGGFERIRQARELHLVDYLSLTEEEAERFFPVFWRYETRLRRIRMQGRLAGLAPHPDERPRPDGEEDLRPPLLPETVAQERLQELRRVRKQLLELQLEAEEAYLEVLPAAKVILVEAAERSFHRKLVRRLGRERRR